MLSIPLKIKDYFRCNLASLRKFMNNLTFFSYTILSILKTYQLRSLAIEVLFIADLVNADLIDVWLWQLIRIIWCDMGKWLQLWRNASLFLTLKEAHWFTQSLNTGKLRYWPFWYWWLIIRSSILKDWSNKSVV